MSKPGFQAGTSAAELFTLATPQGRAHIFNKRIDELMRAKGLTLDDAIYELRTSSNHDDQALLEAMGEKPSLHRTEALQTEQRNRMLDRLAEENAQATRKSVEVAAAAARQARDVAFNARIDELHRKGFSTDQAILQMQANPKDAELLKAMGAA